MVNIPDGDFDIYHITIDNKVYNLVHNQNMSTFGLTTLNSNMPSKIIHIRSGQSEAYGNFIIAYALIGNDGFITTVIDSDMPQKKFRKGLKLLGISDTDKLPDLLNKDCNITPYLQVNKDGQPRVTNNNEQFLTFVFTDQTIAENIPTAPAPAPAQNTGDVEIIECHKCHAQIPKPLLMNHLNSGCKD